MMRAAAAASAAARTIPLPRKMPGALHPASPSSSAGRGTLTASSFARGVIALGGEARCHGSSSRGMVRDAVTCSAAGRAGGRKGGGGGVAASGLLSGVHPESVEACRAIVERAQAASDTWGVDYTDFLDPALAGDALACVGRLADCEARPWGGYDRAERVRLVFGRPEVLDAEVDGFAEVTDDVSGIVALLDVSGNFLFDAADHRDFLGAVLGSGIDRDKVGDILVQGERGAQVLTTPQMATFLSQTLTSVRTVPVKASPAPLSDLRVPPPRVDVFQTVEASMRLDAVGSAGFRMSRSKMADLISQGAVKVNWREGCKSKTVVAEGDVISMRGKGRVEVGAVETTKKGRFSIELTRYL